jgi:transcriptional regulator
VEGGTIIGHVARANPQWEDFDGRTVALAVFGGPHAYVSPRWYGDGRHVPTWNYVAVHLRGTPVIIDDPDEHRAALRALTERFESPEGYSMDALPEEYVAAMVRGTVAFRMRVEHVDAASKLNQNRTPEARRGVVAALEGSEDSAARAIADLMRPRLDERASE